MKKLFLVASCLFLSDNCKSCDDNKIDMNNQVRPVYRKNLTKIVADPAFDLDYYMLRDETTLGRAIRYQAYMDKNFSVKDNLTDCPVPPTPPTTPPTSPNAK